MIYGKAFVTGAEMRTSKKGNEFGIIEIQAMGLSPIEIFANEDLVKKMEVGKEYNFIFKMKEKEISGIASYKLVK